MMPVELQVIRASEFIRLDAHEHLDFEASKTVLRGLAQACLKRGIGCALLDLRSVPVPARPLFTPTELSALVLIFRDAGFSREQRLAVLYKSDVFGGVRNFAFISRMRGLQVRACSEYEEALQWLSKEHSDEAEAQQGEVTVPVKKGQKEGQKLTAGVDARQPSRNKAPRRHRRMS